MQIASLRREDNNFDFLRFVAASAVVLGHCYWLLGSGEVEPVRLLTGSLDTADIAVNLFFVMSGFLIAASWHNSRNALDFAVKRALRIFPALIASVLLTVLIVGPLSTGLPLREYLFHGQTLRYLANMALVTEFHLPGVFTANPFPHTVNGSVWTLPYETLMYVSLMALGLLNLFGRVAVVGLVLTLMLVHFEVAPALGMDSDILSKTTRLGMFFFSGAALYLYRRHIPWNGGIALALLALTGLTAGTERWPFVHVLTLPYLTIYLAHARLGRLSRFGKYGDFSYGIYIYSFPLQQLLVYWLGATVPIGVFMLLSLTLAIALAALSWHLLESPALRLKRWLQGRRVESSAGGVGTLP